MEDSDSTSSSDSNIQITESCEGSPQEIDLSPITSWRRADCDDIRQLRSYWTEQTEKLFGSCDLFHLIESSVLSVALINGQNKSIAFIVVNDYPTPPFLPTSGWEHWIMDMYLVKEFSAQSCRFLHFLVWDKKYEGSHFLEHLMHIIFSEDPLVKYILFILSPEQEIGPPYDRVFKHYLSGRDLTNELRSVREMRLNKEKYLLGLYVAHRNEFGPTVFMKQPLICYNKSVLKNIAREYPTVLKVYGTKFYKKLLKTPRKYRVTITGQCNDDGRTSYGILIVTKKVNTELMEEYYKTFLYHGFRFLNPKDPWPESITKDKISEMRAYSRHQYKRLESGSFKVFISDFDREISQTILDNIDVSMNDFASKVKEEETNSMYQQMTREELLVEQELAMSRPNGIPFRPEELRSLYQRQASDCSSEEATEECVRFTTDGRILWKRTVRNTDNGTSKVSGKKHVSKQNVWREEWNHTQGINTSLVQHQGKLLAFAVELYAPSENQHPLCCYEYLEKAFKEFPDKSFCLITVPPTIKPLPMLHYFHEVDKRINCPELPDLYVCHKLGVMGKYNVRAAFMSDMEEIQVVVHGTPHSKEILTDLVTILIKENSPPCFLDDVLEPIPSCEGQFRVQPSPMRCFIMRCCDLLVAFAIVLPNEDMEQYAMGYNVDRYLCWSAERGDSFGYVKHLVVSQLFHHLTRYFLRGIMKICQWTSLVSFTLPRHCEKYFTNYSQVEALEQWVQVSPRILPQYWSKGVGGLEPNIKQDYPKALHLMTYKISGIQKTIHTCHIVIAGIGPIALSFLENIIFSNMNELIGFQHITLVSTSGIPRRYNSEHYESAKAMFPNHYRYDEDYLSRLSLRNWVEFIEGTVTTINRKNNFVMVNEKRKVRYDYLFLFTEAEFLFPTAEVAIADLKDNRFSLDETYLISKKSENVFKNVFTVNNAKEGITALTSMPHCLELFAHSSRNSKVVVYGDGIESLCCVSVLLSIGFRGSRITLILTPEHSLRNTSYIHNPEVRETIFQFLKERKVNVYVGYTILTWTETNYSGIKYIKEAQFQSGDHIISINVLALFSYERYNVSHHTILACKKAGLTYNEGLVIDGKFLTSDDRIYAAGGLTRYSRHFHTDVFNHQFYNPAEIGAEVARKFLERILNGNHKREGPLCEGVVEFKEPLVMSAYLFEQWSYLRVTKPGKENVIQTDRSLTSKILQTGCVHDEVGPGLFQIMIDENGIVNEILCFSTKEIDTKNLVNLYGKHESLLNNLMYRFEGGQIKDLFSYFRENWAYALYHDRFYILMNSLQLVYLKQMTNEKASFFDLVAHAFNVEKWKQISEKDKILLEDLFQYIPDFRVKIENKVKRFLEENEEVLTTYVTPNRVCRFSEEASHSRLLDDYLTELGSRPLVEHPATPVIPSACRRREMSDRPLKAKEEPVEYGIDDEEGRSVSVTLENGNEETSELMEIFCEGSTSSEQLTSMISNNTTYSDKEHNQKYDLTIHVENIQYENAVKEKIEEFQKCVEEEIEKKKKQ